LRGKIEEHLSIQKPGAKKFDILYQANMRMDVLAKKNLLKDEWRFISK